MLKRKRYIIGGLIACLALGYLVYVLLGSTMAYYSTVSELIGQGESAYNKSVRIKGEVAPGSIESSIENPVLIFIITDGEESLDVVYEGKAADIPDILGDRTEVVLEGKLDSSETFHASSILTKCPEKYKSDSN